MTGRRPFGHNDRLASEGGPMPSSDAERVRPRPSNVTLGLRIHEDMRSPSRPDPNEASLSWAAGLTTEHLVLQEVSKRFDGLEAITKLSLRITAGSIVAVIGANGVGKSTLFDLIGGLHRPDSGTIQFRGRPLIGLRPDQICAAGIGRCFHPPQIFETLSALDTVVVAALPYAQNASEARAHALETLGLMGLAVQADCPVRSFSFSQRKRLELARALATRPRLLLLDQLLTGLEPADIELVFKVLRAFNHRPGLTILLAEPELGALAGLADRVVTLDYGRLVADSNDPVPAMAAEPAPRPVAPVESVISAGEDIEVMDAAAKIGDDEERALVANHAPADGPPEPRPKVATIEAELETGHWEPLP